ncbi:MAG: hypothetical protein N2482_01555 [Patescibacteria group bacterium]|nr:hypothetical protein [Patescibacteria group bacterium]
MKIEKIQNDKEKLKKYSQYLVVRIENIKEFFYFLNIICYSFYGMRLIFLGLDG